MEWFNFTFNDFAIAFLSVLFEGMPFLLLGSLISGMVDVFVSPERMAQILPKSRGAAIFVSGLLGLIFPMCECGNVVIIRRFVRKGLPISCAVTYMLGSPIVSPIVALSTYAAFRGQSPMVMTSLRLGFGYLVAVVAGFIVSQIPLNRLLNAQMLGETVERRRTGLRTASAPETRDFSELAATASFPRKLLLGVQSATADFLDVTFFFVLGTVITSIFNTAIDRKVLEPFAATPMLAIPALMILAALIALCSTTDAFVAASFTAFPFAAKLAFLLFGPVFDLKLFWLYGLIFKRRWVILLAISLFISIAFISWRISLLQL